MPAIVFAGSPEAGVSVGYQMPTISGGSVPFAILTSSKPTSAAKDGVARSARTSANAVTAANLMTVGLLVRSPKEWLMLEHSQADDAASPNRFYVMPDHGQVLVNSRCYDRASFISKTTNS
ncbi:protein of unknown function (plasmid) [Caballeronia sp. S22]